MAVSGKGRGPFTGWWAKRSRRTKAGKVDALLWSSSFTDKTKAEQNVWGDWFFGSQTAVQSTRFDNSQTFYGGTASQPGGSQNATQTSRFDNAQTFYGGKVNPKALQATRFDNAQTFYAGQLNLRITQGARFDNAQAFYSGTTYSTATAVQSARFDNESTFYGGTITTTGVEPGPSPSAGGGVSYFKPRREQPLAPKESIPWDDVFVEEYVAERAEATLEAAKDAPIESYATAWADDTEHAIKELRAALRLAQATHAKKRLDAALKALEALQEEREELVAAWKAKIKQQREDDEAVLFLFRQLINRPIGAVITE